VLERSIKSPLCLLWKAAGRQLAASQVIFQTFAANAFSAARFIAAITILKVLFLFAFHLFTSKQAETI